MLETTERLAAEIEAHQRTMLERSHLADVLTAADIRARLAICEGCPGFLGNTCTQGEPCPSCGGAKDMAPAAFRTRVAIKQWECPDHRWPEEKTDA